MLKCLIQAKKMQYTSIKVVYNMKVYYWSGKNIVFHTEFRLDFNESLYRKNLKISVITSLKLMKMKIQNINDKFLLTTTSSLHLDVGLLFNLQEIGRE